MTYPPQQPEDGWNRQQHGQYPADPGQPDAEQYGQPGYDQAQYGQQQYDPQTGQPYPADQGQYQQGQYPGQYQQEGQYQQGYDQGQYQYAQEGQQQPGYDPTQQYSHEEPPTDQTQSLGNDSDHTQVIGQQTRPDDAGQSGQYGEQQDQYEEPVQPFDSDEPVQPFAPAHDPANPNPQYPAPQYPAPEQPFAPAHDPANPNPQYPAPEQPFAPQAPVSASPASGQPYQAPVSANPASGQPYQAPVSANPASGQPYQGFPPAGQPIYQPNQAPPGVPESPFAVHSAPPAQLPAPISGQPASGQPWAGGVPQFTPKRSRGVPGWVYIVGVVVVVLALALGAVFWFGLPGGSPSAEESPPTSDSPVEDEPVVEGGGDLIADEDTGLGYLSLPEPWAPTADLDGFDGVPGFTSFVGQHHPSEVESDVVGIIGAGGLDGDEVEYLGTDYLRPAATELSEIVDAGLWGDVADLSRSGSAEYEYLRIDGRRAILMTYDIAFSSDTSGETSASVTVAIVDLGGQNAAAFLAQVPGSLVESQGGLVRESVMTMQF